MILVSRGTAAAADFCNSAPLAISQIGAAGSGRPCACACACARRCPFHSAVSLCVCLCTIHLPDCNQGHVILRAVYFSRAVSVWPPREVGPLQLHVHFALDFTFSQYIYDIPADQYTFFIPAATLKCWLENVLFNIELASLFMKHLVYNYLLD